MFLSLDPKVAPAQSCHARPRPRGCPGCGEACNAMVEMSPLEAVDVEG